MMKSITKKLITGLLAISLMLVGIPLSVLAEDQAGIFSLLNELNIMQGDPDGNLRLNDMVTRAEFTKVAVATSDYKNTVATHLTVSPFPDVNYRHWAAPYVRAGIHAGLISGYPDATFRPDQTVLFEEGVTILLRVLGYGDQDFGASWPYGQIGLANNLELCEYVDCSVGEPLNRRQVAQLVYNALKTKPKGQTQQLASIFDVSIQENITMIADYTDDPSIGVDQIHTSYGTYEISPDFPKDVLGSKGEIAIKNNKKILSFLPDTEDATIEEYLLYTVLPDSLMVYRNNKISALDIPDNTPVFKGKTQSTFSNIKNTLNLGDILQLKRSSAGIDSVTCRTGEVKGPSMVSASGTVANWETDTSTRIMRNGISSSMAELEPFDIAYYIPGMNLILAYSDKVTGIYEKATPNKDLPQSITVSGKEYQIESADAFSALASGGSFSYGDTVTLLLGKTGEIAGVIDSDTGTTQSLTGYLLETGIKDYQEGAVNEYTGYYIQVAFPDGNTREYMTDQDLSSYKNKVVTVTFKNGYAKLKGVSSSQKLSGTYTHSNRKLGTETLAPDVQILDIGTTDSNSASVYASIYPQRLDGLYLSSSQILYWEKNTSGAISKIILEDVTGDGFSYGFMTSASNSSQPLSGSYTYFVNGKQYQVRTSSKTFQVSGNCGVKISGNLSNPDSMKNLSLLSGNITFNSASELVHKDTVYPISDSVTVYQKGEGYYEEYIKIPLADILNREDLQISAYYDHTPSSSGQIRVIVVTQKR